MPDRPHLHRLSSVTGNADADYILDLGSGIEESESPTSKACDSTSGAERGRIWRSRSYEKKLAEVKEAKDRAMGRKGSMDKRDCGICFEPALHPRRAPCCQTLFCREHIIDWLTGPNASHPGLCPACDTPCTFSKENDTIVIVTSSPAPSTTTTSDTPTNRDSVAPQAHVHAHPPILAPPETTAGIGEVEDVDDELNEGDRRTPQPYGNGENSVVDINGIKGPAA